MTSESLAETITEAIFTEKIRRSTAPLAGQFTKGDVRRIVFEQLESARQKWLGNGLSVEGSPPKVRKQKPLNAMTEAEFISYLRADPSLAGVDIEKEIGACKSWCVLNGAQATRKRFLVWLRRSEKEITARAGGIGNRPSAPKPIMVEPKGWREWVRENSMNPDNANKAWAELDYSARKYISEQMRQVTVTK